MTRPAPTKVNVRLALRHEGEWWNAYGAPVETMAGAVLLGSIRIRVVALSPELKSKFMQCMEDALSAALMAQLDLDERPSWNEPTPAPEHERSGNS